MRFDRWFQIDVRGIRLVPPAVLLALLVGATTRPGGEERITAAAAYLPQRTGRFEPAPSGSLASRSGQTPAPITVASPQHPAIQEHASRRQKTPPADGLLGFLSGRFQHPPAAGQKTPRGNHYQEGSRCASGFLPSPAPVPRRADRKRSECAPGLTDAGLRPVTLLASRSLRQPVHVPRPAAAAGVSGCHGCCGCSPRASRPRRAHSQPQLRRRADTAPRPAYPQPLPIAPVRSSSCHVPCGAGPAPAARAHAHSQGQPAAVRAAAPTAATVLARCLRHKTMVRRGK